jgi:S-layer family protein
MKGKSRIFLLAAMVSLFFGPTALGLIIDNEEDDPDRPPGIHGPFDEAEYIKAREAFIALRRGNDPNKPIDPTARSRAVEMMDGQVAELQRISRGPNGANEPLAFPNWVELGPNPIPLGQTTTTRVNVSGRISAIEIDPTDPNKVYVGAAQGGVYRSLDGGTTWTPIFDTAQSLAIGTLNLDPVNGWLWVGTGEANGSADSFGGVGLYRIENVNTTATLVGPINPIRIYNDGSGNAARSGFFTGRSISKIIRVPGDPNTLFCGVAGGVIGLGANPPFGNTLPPLAMRGLVRLSNVTGPAAGITGTRVPVSTTDTGLGLCFDTPCTVNRSVNDMVLDPQDPSGNKLIVWLNGINVAGDGGIYRSINAMSGSPTFTQTLVTTSTSTSNGRGELRTYVRSGTTVIYVASGEPSNVPAGATICNTSTQFGALRRSDDGGATWSAKLAGGGGFCGGQCFYNIGFDVVPGAATTTDRLLLGGNVASGNCSRQQSTSLDGGATSFTTHSATTHADTHVIKLAPSNPLVVYRGDDGGVWKSTDGGDNWINQNNTTLKATQFQSIAVHPTDQDITIGGTQDNGTEAITASGPIWLHSDDGDGGFAMIDQSTPATMYHTYFNQTNSQIGYARSLTGGTFGSWSFLGCSGSGTTNGIACSSATTTAVNFYCPTALGPGSPNNTVYIGTDRLLRSDTQGTANVTVSQAPIHSGVAISAIGISLLDDSYRIVGLNNGEIWFTTTGSSTLTSLDPVGVGSVIPDFYVARLVFDPSNKNTVYIALGNYANGTLHTQSHVWRVTNLNTTPVLTSLNGTGVFTLPDVPVNGFAVDPLKPSRLFAGTDIGVYLSEDGGTNWFPFGTGLPRVAVFDMAIQNVKRVVRIATHGRGMWEVPIPAFSLDAFYKSFPGNTVGNGTVNVTGPSGPAWTALSNDSWIHITNAGPGTGNGAVTYTVDINLSTTANRSGTMTIALQTFTVYQGAAFLDVPPVDPFYDDIGRLSARGITVGCGAGNYCPNNPVLRDQMAAFIVRAIGEFNPATPASQRFNDVPPANPFYDFIDRLAVLQITLGCTPDHLQYCPSNPVQRQEMAAFIIRALGEFDPPTPGTQRFNDVPPANVFYNFIDRMAVLNITLGCTPDHLFYCPNDSVTRAQMAAFLVRAFNL